MGDLVIRDGLIYKKFNDTPFTGKVPGKEQGSSKNVEKEGEWVEYWDWGQLITGPSCSGGTFQNGEKVSD